MGTLPIIIFNLLMFRCYIIVIFECYNITLQKCFIIMIGVHGRSLFPFCSLEGLNNKEQGGKGYLMFPVILIL